MKGKITKRGEGCEGEAFTHIVQVINELRAKGEEVKEKKRKLADARARARGLFSTEIGGNFTPLVGFPFQDGIGDTVRLEPGFGAGNHFVELFGARGARQLRATLLAAHPRNGGGRIGINGHFRALLVQEGEGVDDGEKLADVVRAVDGAEMKDLARFGEEDAAVFHRTGIAGAGGVDTERLEAHFGQHLGRGHVDGADTESRRGRRLRGSGGGALGRTMGWDVLLGFIGRGILRFVAGGEGFVTRTGKTLDLFATLVPRGVDSGDAAAPNDVELGFLATHGQKKEQRDEERCAKERRGERKRAILPERVSDKIALGRGSR